MLTCIACSKHHQIGAASAAAPPGSAPSLYDHSDADDPEGNTPTATRHAIKAITSQIKDMALKASGAYRNCKPCAGGSARRHHPYQHRRSGSEVLAASSDHELQLGRQYRRAGGSVASTPSSSKMSGGHTDDEEWDQEGVAAGDEEEMAARKVEWVAQVETGVLITFVSLPDGAGNDLKRIRFSRDIFNKWQAQHWWADNCDKIMELYNVHRFTHQHEPAASSSSPAAAPAPTTPKSEDEISKDDSILTPTSEEDGEEEVRLPHYSFDRRMVGGRMNKGNSSSNLTTGHDHNGGHHRCYNSVHHCYESVAPASTPKLSGISGAKTETSSMDASMRNSGSSPDEEVNLQSDELSVSVSNVSDQEREWVEQDEPGVYITIRSLPGGMRELRRVRFSRERFNEMHARLWWEENRARIHQQYL